MRAVRSGLRGDVQPIQSDAEEAGGGGKQEVEARRCARVGTRRSPVGKEDDRGGGQVGWAGHLGRQVSPGEIPSLSLLSVLYFCFLFCSVFLLFNSFATVLN